MSKMLLPITVLYDGKCSLCAKEIKYYKGIAPNGLFIWADIATTPAHLEGLDLSLAQGLKALHAIDSNGTQHKGVDAFIIIWSQLKRWRWLAKLVSLPIIHHVAGGIYKTFAAWRFKRLKHCQLALSDDTTTRENDR